LGNRRRLGSWKVEEDRKLEDKDKRGQRRHDYLKVGRTRCTQAFRNRKDIGPQRKKAVRNAKVIHRTFTYRRRGGRSVTPRLPAI